MNLVNIKNFYISAYPHIRISAHRPISEMPAFNSLSNIQVPKHHRFNLKMNSFM